MNAWNPKQAAEFLGVKVRTVIEWAKQERIPAAKVGRFWRFDEASVRDWLRTGAMRAATCKKCDVSLAKYI